MPIFFSKQISLDLTLSTPSQEGSGSITQDIIFQHPLKPEGGPEGDTNNVFSKEDRLRQRFSPRLTSWSGYIY